MQCEYVSTFQIVILNFAMKFLWCQMVLLLLVAFLRGYWNLKGLRNIFLCVLFSSKFCECWKVEQCAKFVFCQNCRFVFPNLLGDGPWVLLKSKKLLSHVLFWICYLLGWNCYKCFMGFKLWICVVWESPSSFNMAQNLSTSKIVCCHNISFLVVM